MLKSTSHFLLLIICLHAFVGFSIQYDGLERKFNLIIATFSNYKQYIEYLRSSSDSSALWQRENEILKSLILHCALNGKKMKVDEISAINSFIITLWRTRKEKDSIMRHNRVPIRQRKKEKNLPFKWGR